jgi:hypothetical protein
MMITITSEDFRKLSASCQRELLSLLSPNEEDTAARDDEMALPYMDVSADGFNDFNAQTLSAMSFDGSASSAQVPESGSSDATAKRVIDISIEQAQELIANVSDKSQQALKLFATGQPVLLNTLIGSGGPYRDFNDLKRSLVGAVNRRLRTVTENRSAVLFSSDRKKEKIRITQSSAASLRRALDVQEPAPLFEFFDDAGRALPNSSHTVEAFQKGVQAAWTGMTLRPAEWAVGLSVSQTLGYLVQQGFKLATARLQSDGCDTEFSGYEFISDGLDEATLSTKIDTADRIESSDPEGSIRLRVFLTHQAAPGIFALPVV